MTARKVPDGMLVPAGAQRRSRRPPDNKAGARAGSIQEPSGANATDGPRIIPGLLPIPAPDGSWIRPGLLPIPDPDGSWMVPGWFGPRMDPRWLPISAGWSSDGSWMSTDPGPGWSPDGSWMACDPSRMIPGWLLGGSCMLPRRFLDGSRSQPGWLLQFP